MQNEMYVKLKSVPENEALARTLAGAFAAELNPTIDVLSDIKTAVSEAVTNAIVHGYAGKKDAYVEMDLKIEDRTLSVTVKDTGRGIENLPESLEMFYTTGGEDERSGMGFTIMKTFMDSFLVESEVGEGTVVKMTKSVS